MAEPACTLVREELREVAETGETYYYYPRSAILRVLNSNDNLRRVYLCDCASCRTDFNIGPDARLDNRHQTLDPEALLGNYATVYALLICSQRPGLIRYFQKHRTFLHGTTFFTRENLEFLTSESVRRTRSIIDDILRDQYSFQIRVMERSLEPITIHPREMLPIRQDRQEIGRGSFGQVFGFEFSYDEYRGKGLQHATRFARKIFFNSLNSSDVDAGLTEWFNNLQLERLQHGHLMPALMAFWHEGRFSIVFEQAQQTLDAYLESDGSLYSHEALWQQVQGLAAGLAHLHGNGTEVIAHHGDLKPANILIVNGVMKIADFGLLQIHHRAQLASNQPLTSDSYQLASTRPYAGPSGDKALMDVWSFGAILSEIATFNLEDSNALDRFRHSRLEDFPRDAPGFRTKGFHHDGRLKPSVARTIDELYELVRGGRQTQHGVHISQFQQHFFTEDFFSLLHQMLSDRLAECPSSQHVANTLERLQQQATQFQQHPVDRSDQRGDIWGDFTAGLVLPGTQGLGYRLCAELLEGPANSSHAKCGLLLNERNNGAALVIHCVFYNYSDVDTYVVREPFIRMGQARPSFDPLYTGWTDATNSLKATLRQWDDTQYTFQFTHVRDVLTLQAAMIQQYAFNFDSFGLESFEIFPRRFPGVNRQPAIRTGKVVVQLWSEMPLLEGQSLWSNTPEVFNPRMHIAVICLATRKLILLKVSSERIARPLESSDNEKATVTLENIHYYKIPITHGFPMHIPEAESGYDERREAHLSFSGHSGSSAEQNAKLFRQHLKEFQGHWEKRKSQENGITRR